MIFIKCSKCNKDLKDNSTFCGYCGNHFMTQDVKSEVFCHECGFLINDESKFCPGCGTNLNKALENIISELVVEESNLEYSVLEQVPDLDSIIEDTKQEKQDVNNKKSKKISNKEKKKGKKLIFSFIIVFIILLIALGTVSGYYVAKNGWNDIPFSEKLQFLPIYKQNDIAVEVYEEMPEELPVDEKEKSPEEISSDNLQDVSPTAP